MTSGTQRSKRAPATNKDKGLSPDRPLSFCGPVAKRCDLAVFGWVDAYMRDNPVKTITAYKAKASKAAKFEVKQ